MWRCPEPGQRIPDVRGISPPQYRTDDGRLATIICLPVLFTAGMTLMDTTDGLFMNLAYGWAFFNPVRKVYYNLAITGLSVAICFVIGAVEALSLLPQEIHGLSRTTGFWGLMYRFNINTAGFVIVGLFLATWLAALLIWRFARIEEKWNQPPVRHARRHLAIDLMRVQA